MQKFYSIKKVRLGICSTKTIAVGQLGPAQACLDNHSRMQKGMGWQDWIVAAPAFNGAQPPG